MLLGSEGSSWTEGTCRPKGECYCVTELILSQQEKIRGQRGRIRALAGTCRFQVIFNFRQKRRPVSPYVRIVNSRSPFPLFYDVIFIDKTNLHAVCHFIAFAPNHFNADVSENRLSFERYRQKITLVELTYPKAWTWSLPLCPLIFSWSQSLSEHCSERNVNYFCIVVRYLILNFTRAWQGWQESRGGLVKWASM